MKKTVFSTILCLLLCAVMLLSPVKVNPAQAAEDTSALVGSSLYFDDQVDLHLYFDAEILSQKGDFTLTTTFNGKTYTAADLFNKKDPGTGKTYKVLSVGPFAATEYNTAFSYTGSCFTSASFALTDLARNSIAYYEKSEGYAENEGAQNTASLLKAFVNYGIAADNKNTGKTAYLPYEVNFTTPEFTANPGNGTPLAPTRVLTGRQFVLAEDVLIRYQGALLSGDNVSTWTVSLNSVDMTDKCNFTTEGSTFSFTLPIMAEQGQDKLRIIVRDGSGKVLFDCIDRADKLAVELAGFEGYEELSATLASFLQATYNYAMNPNPSEVLLEDDTFYAGYGKVDITPYADAVMLNSKTATEFMDPIAATCVAIRDPLGTVSLIYSLDIRNVQSTRNEVYQTIRDTVSSLTGIDPDHIFFNATHNHSAPSVTSSDATVTAWYDEYFYPRVPVAAKKALDDLTAVTGAFAGETETTSGTNYNRRYKTGGYEDGADKTLRTIRFERAAGKDILLVNWQCHAAHGAGVTPDKGTADFIQQLRLVVEGKVENGGMDMHLLYINGASGDLNMTPRGQSTHPDYIANGKKVASSIKGLVGSSKEKAATLGNIYIQKTSIFADLQYRTHRDGSYCYDPNCGECKKDYITAKTAGVSAFKTETQYNAYVNQKNGANLPVLPTTIDLWTMTVGEDIGFAFVPYEMFNQNGVQLRAAVNTANGGGKTIFTAGYTNGYLGYMPSERAFANVESRGDLDEGVCEVHTTHYVRGTAERCITTLASDLTTLFNK